MIRGGICELHACHAPGGFCIACATEQESWLAAPANDDDPSTFCAPEGEGLISRGLRDGSIRLESKQ